MRIFTADRVLLAITAALIFSPTVAGTFARAAFVLPLYWLGIIPAPSYDALAAFCW